MQERRVIQRRQNQQKCVFPLQTKDHEIIVSDRRYLPDRRLASIEVKEITCDDFIAELSRMT